MTLSFEAAQAVVGLAVVDQRFARLLGRERGQALREAAAHRCVPPGTRLGDEDRLLLGSIRATSLAEFARGVDRLCGEVRSVRTPAAPAAAASFDEMLPEAMAAATAPTYRRTAPSFRAPSSAG